MITEFIKVKDNIKKPNITLGSVPMNLAVSLTYKGETGIWIFILEGCRGLDLNNILMFNIDTRELKGFNSNTPVHKVYVWSGNYNVVDITGDAFKSQVYNWSFDVNQLQKEVDAGCASKELTIKKVIE